MVSAGGLQRGYHLVLLCSAALLALGVYPYLGIAFALAAGLPRIVPGAIRIRRYLTGRRRRSQMHG
jgi:hypothetical protein